MVMPMLMVILAVVAASATSVNAATSPDIIRPSAIVLDARAYITPYFMQNTTSAMEQLLLFYSYVPQWWLTWGNPVPLHVVLPDYFGNIFQYPYTDAENNTMPFAYFVIEQIKTIPNVVMSITTSQNTATLLESKTINICQYGAQYGMACNLRVETANVSFAAGSFYDLGFQDLQSSLVNTSVLFQKEKFNTSYLLPYVLHDLDSLAEMTVTPNVNFANAAPTTVVWIADATPIQYYGMNGTLAVFAFTNTIYKTAHMHVSKIQIDATAMLTATPQYLQQFINYAATQGVAVELYLSNIEWGLTTYNGYLSAYTTMGDAINFVYSGNQTYPASAPGTIPTMTPAPSTSVPTFAPTLVPTNIPTNAGSNPGEGNGFNSTAAPTSTHSSGSLSSSQPTTHQSSPAPAALQPMAVIAAAVMAIVTVLAAASV